LPVAVCLTYALIINTALQPPTNFQEAIPVILLVGVLGLPAILVLIGWMVIYLLSLPIWNFVLPAYSFIKMDGEYRRLDLLGKSPR
jgi:chitin synthase